LSVSIRVVSRAITTIAISVGMILGLAVTARAATITIINGDGAGEGFNSTTPATPVGGNSGTTVGRQRLNVFQAAADIWGSLLTSTVTIRVRATFDPLTPCGSRLGLLGSAGPLAAAANFPGAGIADVFYPIALANRQHGSDLDPTQDDIIAHFNSDVDNSTCLGSTSWYYGLDHRHGSNLDLLVVVLHELAHGLGFLSFVDVSTGQQFNGLTDAFSRLLFDNQTGLTWDRMSDAQRQASAVNTGHLTWSGNAVRNHVPDFLAPRAIARIDAPASLAGPLDYGTAAFGPPLTSRPIRGEVERVDDGIGDRYDASEAIVNGDRLRGRIALVDRGGTPFVAKTRAAEAAEAIAVVVVDDRDEDPPTLLGDDPSIGIPTISVSRSTGERIAALASAGVEVTLGGTLHYVGADDADRMLMYAPSSLQSGSSVSHWDVSATPDLLMEPFISDGLSGDVDLTRWLLEDVGWASSTGGGGHKPSVAQLGPSTPNPFGATTTISFEMRETASAELEIHDLAGRLVKRLPLGTLAAGPHTAVWNGQDEQGRHARPGVYLYRVHAGDYSPSLRLVRVE
jgi:hypothetical protein